MNKALFVAVTAILALSACSDGPKKRLDGSTGQTIDNAQRKSINNPPIVMEKLIDRKGVSDFLERWEATYPNRDRITVCSGHGCVFKQRYSFDPEVLKEVQSYVPGGNAPEERDGVVKALEQLSLVMKQDNGLSEDKPGESVWNNGVKGQTSDSDETVNLTSLLAVLAENGLLSYHKVLPGQTVDGMFSRVVPAIEDISTKEVWLIISSDKDGRLYLIRKKTT
jgi:hypothetical protein